MNAVSLICLDCMETVDVPLADAKNFRWCPKCKAPRDAAIAAAKAKREEELRIAKEKYEKAKEQQESYWRGWHSSSNSSCY